MRRLVLTLTALAGCAVAAGPAALSASAASVPPPCPVRQLVHYDQTNQVVYVSVGCTSVAVPLPRVTH